MTKAQVQDCQHRQGCDKVLTRAQSLQLASSLPALVSLHLQPAKGQRTDLQSHLSDQSKTWFSARESWLASGKFKGSPATCHMAEQPLSWNDRWHGAVLRNLHLAGKCSADVGERAVWQLSGLCRGCCKVAEEKRKGDSLISMQECQTIRACPCHHWILPCGDRDLWVQNKAGASPLTLQKEKEQKACCLLPAPLGHPCSVGSKSRLQIANSSRHCHLQNCHLQVIN